ncbi:MAG: McrC family protein [Thermodesulfobacteriota bacterium]
MESIVLIEHEALPILPERSKGQKALSIEHADALGRLEKKLPSQTFTWGNRSVKFAQYCGVISLGNLTLEILPKIYGKETEPGECRKALVKMLVKAKKIKPQRGGCASIALQKHALLDIFILNFCELLHGELMQGMIQHYIERNENLNILRGRLRTEKQFKYNLTHKERLYCQYDELRINNPHNQVIKFVLKLMMRLPAGAMAKKQLAELLMRFDAVSDVDATLQIIDGLTFNRVTCRYEPIFEQCRWFLQGLYPDVFAGQESCISLLFDMNRLFESYVAGVMRKEAWKEEQRLLESGCQKFMVLRNDRNEPLFLMKPDMVFLDRSDRIIRIADAKWKMLDDREKKLGISQADLYQMASYSMRYGIEQLVLVYPKQQWLKDKIDLQLQGKTATIQVIPIDVMA